MPNTPDQTDVIAQNETLTADLAASQALVATATAASLALTAERDALAAQLATANAATLAQQTLVTERTQERDALRLEINALKTKDNDFHKAVAAEVAKRGIREQASETPDTNKPMTATEKVLAAKGVSSLAELEQLRKK